MTELMSKKVLIANCGTLGNPSKMPGFSYGLPARINCNIGGKLALNKLSTCFYCYADNRNNYAYPSVKKSQTNRLSKLDNLPLWTVSMIQLINRECKRINEFYFRWFDSGDIQGMSHLLAIIEIANKLPNVKFWLPTKEYNLVANLDIEVPDNLVIRVSHPMLNLVFKPGKYSNTSSVLNADNMHKAANLCPAPKQGNSCLECRKCWNKSIDDISYKLH